MPLCPRLRNCSRGSHWLRIEIVYLEKTHNLAEGAGVASLAATVKMRERLQGRKVALILSGGNLSLAQLRVALEV